LKQLKKEGLACQVRIKKPGGRGDKYYTGWQLCGVPGQPPEEPPPPRMEDVEDEPSGGEEGTGENGEPE
jgi:hypothetical protein